MSKPFISVVTCCYNQGEFLADNIEAVLAQHYPDFEHIVVDDGSTDTTHDVCANYGHVQYIYQENQGQSAALNTGFKQAKGDIIAWINSDDYYEADIFNYVAHQINPAEDRCILSGKAKVVGPQGELLWTMANGPTPFHRLLFHPKIYQMKGRIAMPCQPSVFFHRNVLDTCGLLDTSLKYAMDYDYWLRAMKAGFSFTYRNRFFSYYRFHETSHSNQGFDTFLPEWQAVSDRHYKALPLSRKFAAKCWLAGETIRSEQYRKQQEKINQINHHAVQIHPIRDRTAHIKVPPLVSVIIPVYNGEAFIKETITSALEQSYAPIEMLVVNDGSTDKTADLLQELSAAHPTVVSVLHHPGHANKGVSASRNLALKHAKGSYIAFLDADDLWEPDKIMHQIQLLEQRPEIGLCFTGAKLLRDEYGSLFMPEIDDFDQPYRNDPQSCFRQILDGSLLCAFSSVVARKSCIEEAGGFEEQLPYQFEDRLLLTKMAAKHDIAMLDAMLTGYRIHTANSTAEVVKSGTAPVMFFDLQTRIVEWLCRQDNIPYAHLLFRHLLHGTWLPSIKLASTRPDVRPILCRGWTRLFKECPVSSLHLLWKATCYLCFDRYQDRYRYPHELKAALAVLIPELVRAGIKHVWLYGAGQHTERVLAMTDFKPLLLQGIIDDYTQLDQINEIPIKRPADITTDNKTALIISSDTSQSRVYKQAKKHGLKNIYRIY